MLRLTVALGTASGCSYNRVTAQEEATKAQSMADAHARMAGARPFAFEAYPCFDASAAAETVPSVHFGQ
jgi:hypothetical protein